MRSPIKWKQPSWLLRRGCGALLLVLTFSVSASADYVISVDSTGGTNVNLGLPGANRTIDFFIGEDVGAGSSLPMSGTTAIFMIQAGIVGGTEVVPGDETADNATGRVSATGFTGTPGYFGAGSLVTSTIFKQSDLYFAINQAFPDFSSQPLNDFTSPERWFTLNLDTSGLAPGDYAISLENPDTAFRDVDNMPVPTRANLSFTIAAVPEPSSCAMLAVVGGIAGATGRFRRRRIEVDDCINQVGFWGSRS
ncbi:hypothetical protein Q31b_28480 [Novipirellula aureliae]|uniref:Uncharacterized protein n=1 Tax=Novipirellula aureliae TaxID=2527966 RepID=A0A5C6DYU2_9BACT|nr:PEP-CTERM sorting domain-containing protein [Novipirellula aureliae]TWU41404.1 hypothetical protein Q31b_28480 [Novipirellula aureliae]